MPVVEQARSRRDFWIFFVGQAISNLGSSITGFALPLLIFERTGSALNLGLVTAANYLPYLLFGLVIGAWADRTDRRRFMIAADAGQALAIASIPLLAAFGGLPLWWIYVATFLNSTLFICFSSAEFAAVPSLVAADDLVAANGRIQASYATAQILGPVLGGLLAIGMPIEALLLLDAGSFVVSSLSLILIRTRFNSDEPREPTNLRQDIVEGLRYVISHPVLRNISIMMALVNFVASTTHTQLVLFAQRQLGANEAQVGFMYAAGSGGIVLTSLCAGALRKRFSFSVVALGALMLQGLMVLIFSQLNAFWPALLIWGLVDGFGILFNINTGSLRQAIVPRHLLSRVMSIAGVLAWSAIPVGTLLGGFAIEWTGNVALVYAIIGLLTALIAFGFWFTALGRADSYLPTEH